MFGADDSAGDAAHCRSADRAVGIRPRLNAALRETKDEEVRTRVEAALRQIEENRATGASLITLHMKGAKPAEVFAEIARQASAELRASPVNLWESKSFPAIDIDMDRVPFWQAIGNICDKFGLAPQNNMAMEMVIGEKSAGPKLWGEAPSVISGPFLVVCASINRSHSIDLNQAKNVRRTCTVQFMIYPEPKMRVLQGTHAVRIEEAVDENGNTLAIPAVLRRIWDSTPPTPGRVGDSRANSTSPTTSRCRSTTGGSCSRSRAASSRCGT